MYCQGFSGRLLGWFVVVNCLYFAVDGSGLRIGNKVSAQDSYSLNFGAGDSAWASYGEQERIAGENGSLSVSEGDGKVALHTLESYADYTLEFEVYGKPVNFCVAVRAKRLFEIETIVEQPEFAGPAMVFRGSDSKFPYGSLAFGTSGPPMVSVGAPEAGEVAKDEQWNACKIVVLGSRVQTRINNFVISDIDDPVYLTLHRAGFIAIVCGRGSFEIRNLKLSTLEAKPTAEEQEPLKRVSPVRFTPGPSVDVNDQMRSVLTASVSNRFYHNRVLIEPEEIQVHEAWVTKLLSEQLPITRLARLIVARDVLAEEAKNAHQDTQALHAALPAAWRWSAVFWAARALAGEEPSPQQINREDPPGGIVSAIDQLRGTETFRIKTFVYFHKMCRAIAEAVANRYRQLQDEIGASQPLQLHVEMAYDTIGQRLEDGQGPRLQMGGQLARITNIGDHPLEDVFVVSHTDLKPVSAESNAVRGFAGFFNQAFGDNVEQTIAADNYIEAAQELHSSPQSYSATVRRLEPGDSILLPLYEQGFFWNIQEAKVSVYATCGRVEDVVLMVAGPHNDDKADPAQRERHERSIAPVEVGPRFSEVISYERVMISLADDIDPKMPRYFESCYEHGKSIMLRGEVVELSAGTPYEGIANIDAGWVVAVPKSFGLGLVYIPSKLIGRFDRQDVRSDEEKALAQKRLEERKAATEQAERRKREMEARNRNRRPPIVPPNSRLPRGRRPA